MRKNIEMSMNWVLVSSYDIVDHTYLSICLMINYDNNRKQQSFSMAFIGTLDSGNKLMRMV